MSEADNNDERLSETSAAQVGAADKAHAEPVTEPPPGDASPEEVFLELFKRFGQGQGVPNERRFERYAWIIDLTAWLEEPSGTTRTLDATTHDLSRGGFSFVYRQFLHAGTKIRVRFNILPNRSTVAGVVRNCDWVGGHHHRVGVEFVRQRTKRGRRTDVSNDLKTNQ